MKRVGSNRGGLAGIPGGGGSGSTARDLAGSLPAQPMLSEQRMGREPRWAGPDAAWGAWCGGQSWAEGLQWDRPPGQLRGEGLGWALGFGAFGIFTPNITLGSGKSLCGACKSNLIETLGRLLCRAVERIVFLGHKLAWDLRKSHPLRASVSSSEMWGQETKEPLSSFWL